MMSTLIARQHYFLRLQNALGKLSRLSVRGEWLVIVGGLLVSMATLLLVLLLPGRTYVGQYAHDILVFLDGGYRILQGQVPNRDFHTPLGPLAFLFPALGLKLGGSLGAMMPLGTAAFALIFAPLLIYVSGSRLPLWWALAFGLFMLLLVITPLNPGETQDSVSFAMFYNRFCWALLSTLFLMIIPSKAGVARVWLDAVVIAALLLLMFYLKISYVAFGLVFVTGTILLRAMRRTAMLSLVLTAAGILLIELFWSGTGGYLLDIQAAATASGAMRGTIFTLGRTGLDNLSGYILFAGLLLVGLLRGVHFIYILFALYMSAAGLLIINQNAQVTGIVTLVSAGLVMMFAPAGKERQANYFRSDFAGALLLIALAVPPAIINLVTLVYHGVNAARAPSENSFEARVDGLVTLEGQYTPSAKALPDIYRTGMADRETVNMLRHAPYRQPLGQTEYLRTVEDALQMLRNDALKGGVFVMDMVNPLNALADRVPPIGVDAWYHAGRTFNDQKNRAPETLFAYVDVVMIPKNPVELTTSKLLRKLYGPYIDAHYELKAESTYWWGYRRKTL